MHSILGKKGNRLSLALIAALGCGGMAQQAVAATGEFCMFDANGDPVSDGSWAPATCDEAVTATIVASTPDVGTPGSSISSAQVFYGLPWTAHDVTTYGPGTYSVDTGNGLYNFTVADGQIGIHILFDWSVNTNIDVVNIWDVTDVAGTLTYTSTDWDGDGTPGGDMIDGPFQGFSANFNLTGADLPPPPDTVAPVITLGGDNPTTLAVGGTFTETATCADAIEGDITEASGLFVIDASALDVNTPGSYVITYDCQDSVGNAATQGTRTVNVQAASAPVITLTGANPLTFEAAATFTDPGATCDDAFAIDGISPGDGAITPTITSSDVVSDVPGSYSVVYECTDSDAETATATRTVTVVDTTAPTISLGAACPIAVMGGAAFADPTPTATASDIVDGNLTAALALPTAITSPTFATGELSQSFTQTYSVSDAAGNTATASCQVIVGNPTPVVTLTGAANVTVNEGDGYTDPGATCQDFNVATPGTPDTLTATADMSIDTSTPAGSYTITYSCTDADNFTGTVTRSVVVASATGGGYTAAPTTSGSNFSMLDPTGAYVGGAADIYSNWDGTLLTSTAQATINMTMGSARPEPFFGFPWVSHDIRVFGPGSYTLTTSRGNPLSFTVGPNQIGAHMLFDWNNNNNIDVAIVWDINGAFGGAGPASGQVFNLVSVDGDGDGFPGIRMPDGPFTGFSANFNINFTPAYALAAAQAPLLTASQGSNTTRTVVTGGGPVIVTASTTGTFDWSTSSGALLTVEDTADGDDAVFTFDPSGLAPGTYTVAVTVDGVPGSLLISVVSSAGGLDVADADNDGIPNYLDDTATPTIMQLTPGGGSIVAGSGMLELGDTAFVSGADGVAVSAAEITAAGGVADSTSSESCIGGCFDFAVTGVTPGGSVQVVLPLSASIPANAVYRKLIGGAWRDFSATGGNAIASAMAVNGVCPAVASGDYTDGLTAGNDCVRLTLVDGGPNDADGAPNGIVRDPGGVAVAAAVQAPVSTIGDPGLGGGGCTLAARPASAARAGDWLLIGLALAGLAFLRRRVA